MGLARPVGLALVLVLAGCAGGGLDLGPGLLSGDAGKGVRSYAIFGGEMRVRGPDGYCIDTAASRPRRGFVVLASCARASGVGLAPDVDALVTVQVGDAGSAFVTGSEVALAEALAVAGPGALGDGAVLEGTTISPGMVTARYSGGTPPVPGTEGPFRRALFDLGDRSVTVALLPFAGAPLSDREAEALLLVVVGEMRAANAPGG